MRGRVGKKKKISRGGAPPSDKVHFFTQRMDTTPYSGTEKRKNVEMGTEGGLTKLDSESITLLILRRNQGVRWTGGSRRKVKGPRN